MGLGLRLAGAAFGLFGLLALQSSTSYSLRARRSEARVNLRELHTVMEAFRADEGFYPAIEVQPPIAEPLDSTGRRAWGALRCDAACRGGAPWACRYFDCLGWAPRGDPRYFYACSSTCLGGVSDFTCAAVGDLDGDGVFAVFVIGSSHGGSGTIVAPIPSIAGAGRCAPGETPADQVVDCTPGVW